MQSNQSFADAVRNADVITLAVGGGSDEAPQLGRAAKIAVSADMFTQMIQ